jgi:hypothetical protein
MRTLLFLASAATYAHADTIWPDTSGTDIPGDIGGLSTAVQTAGCNSASPPAGCQAYSDLANAFVDLGDFTGATFTILPTVGQDGHYDVGNNLWLMHVDVFQLCESYTITGATITQPTKAECDAFAAADANTNAQAWNPGWPNANGCLIGGSGSSRSYYWNTIGNSDDVPLTSSATAFDMSANYRQLCHIVSDAPPPPECIHPDVPVHVLRGVSVETVKVGRLNVGDVVIGEGKTSAVKRVEHFSVDDEACVVPKDLCGGFDDNVVVSKSHAVRCQTWPTNTWTFCQPDWQRVMTTEYVHVELESYLDDHLLSGSIVLESWDGYTRETDSIKDACSTRGCPWPHKWSSTDDNRWTRVDLRSVLHDASPRLRQIRPL